MYLKVQKRNGRAYLSVVQNYRQNGKVKSRTVETIGYADAYAGQFEDPIEHFREYVDQLNRDEAAKSRPIDLSFEIDDEIDPSDSAPVRLGASIALGCLDALGVGRFFHVHANHEGFPEHVGRIFEMLAVERMTHVTSKRESWSVRNSFPRTCDFTFRQVYESLPCIALEKENIAQAMSSAWKRIGESPGEQRVFLVCGNYSFPADDGTARAGVAVALDGEGMPLGYSDCMGGFGPGVFRQVVEETQNRLGEERIVVVAGGQEDIGATIDELTTAGAGFVLYHRNFWNVPDLASWAQDDRDYTHIGADVRMKWRNAERECSDKTMVPVKEIVLRGGGYATNYSHALLVCSELDLSASAIVNLYRELWRQSEPFQPLEADFASMPYPVPTPVHIQAHFAICYASFFALRMLRWKMGWTYNAADTADALMRMDGVHLQQNYYLFDYRSQASDAIERSVGVPLARRIRSRADLRSVPGLVKGSFAPRHE